MKLLNQNYQILEPRQITENTAFWTFNLTKKDFFLKTTTKWYDFRTDAYHLEIAGNTIKVPNNYYILIGDYDVGLDTIKPEEIVGREFEAFVFNNDFEENSWTLESIKIVGYEENTSFIIPNVRFPIPIAISPRKCIIVSQKEMYNRIKYMTFPDIV